MNADNHERPLILQIASSCSASPFEQRGPETATTSARLELVKKESAQSTTKQTATSGAAKWNPPTFSQQQNNSTSSSGSRSQHGIDKPNASKQVKSLSASSTRETARPAASVSLVGRREETSGSLAKSSQRSREPLPTTATTTTDEAEELQSPNQRCCLSLDTKSKDQLNAAVAPANQLNRSSCRSASIGISISSNSNTNSNKLNGGIIEQQKQQQQVAQQRTISANSNASNEQAGARRLARLGESHGATSRGDNATTEPANNEANGTIEPSAVLSSQLNVQQERAKKGAQIESQTHSVGESQDYNKAATETQNNSSNSLLFWKFLSNLPTSITQRGRLHQGLAPEVAGYLANKQRQQKRCDFDSNMPPPPTQNQQKTSASSAQNSSITTSSASRLISTMNPDSSGDTRPPPYDGCQVQPTASGGRSTRNQQQQQPPPSLQQEMIMMNYSGAAATTTTKAGSKLIRIVAPQAEANRQEQISNANNHHQQILQSSSIRDQPIPATRLAQQQHIDLEQAQRQQQHLQANQRTRLSIGSSRSANTSGSSATSLSSCILSTDTSGSEGVARLKWSKKMDFLLSIIGFAVDLANIWRFPYLVYKNGGGVFLIPYLIMLIFGGIPLFFLELCLGQFVKKGPITVWNKICPSMKGVGYCSIMISWYVSFYYNVLIAWSVYFIYRSLTSFGDKMPWEDCDNAWNSKGTCVSINQLKELCSKRDGVSLETCRKDMFNSINVTSPASEFFVKELSQIDQSTGLDDMGYLRWELVFCTMIVYLLHYFALFRGLETSGKVVWVTATAPYMILSILLIRGLYLPGATMGIKYYLSPKLEKLADPQVWIDAAGQVFYSIGVGFGVHLTYASFNSHNNNCYRDCLMTSAVNALTSVYSGLVVFVYLGYMAKNLGIEIDKVASEGYSLVFEVYPEALTTLPFARFWSILFFIMLLTLGIDSAMGGLEAVITGLEDEFKFARRLSRGQLTGLVIVSSFLPALISCTQGGAYTLFWFDIYSAGVSLLFSALFETIGVVYCYGLKKFIPNIESMLGRKPPLFYILCWKYISPIFLGGVIFMSIYTAGVPTYRGYTFPLWSIILGWCLAFSSVAAIPIVAAWYWGKRWLMGSSLDKSSRKRDRGSSSVASSRHGSSKKSPSHRSVSVSCGLQSQGGLTNTTTSILAKSPNDNKTNQEKYHGLADSIEDML